MSNMGAKLKVTPCLKCLNHCYDNERRPMEECNSKEYTVAPVSAGATARVNGALGCMIGPCDHMGMP